MEANVLELANDQKIHNNDGYVTAGDIDTPVNEEFVEKNAAPSTVAGYEDRLPQEVIKINEPPKKHFLNMNIEDDDAVSDVDGDFERMQNDKYGTNINKRIGDAKRRKLKRIKHRAKVPIPDIPDDADLEYIELVEDTAIRALQKKRRAKFIWNGICMFCLILEKVITKIGYSVKFNGWADEIAAHEKDYMEDIDQMIADTVYLDPETGDRTVVKNKSFIAKMNIDPSINILFRLVYSAFRYAGANNFSNLGSYIHNGQSFENEEEVINKLPIEEHDDE